MKGKWKMRERERERAECAAARMFSRKENIILDTSAFIFHFVQ
jgi:hypothetical protein